MLPMKIHFSVPGHWVHGSIILLSVLTTSD